MFVLWSCGCKGLKLTDANIAITSCGNDVGHTVFEIRQDLASKAFLPLPREQSKKLTTKLAEMLTLGCKFKHVIDHL